MDAGLVGNNSLTVCQSQMRAIVQEWVDKNLPDCEVGKIETNHGPPQISGGFLIELRTLSKDEPAASGDA